MRFPASRAKEAGRGSATLRRISPAARCRPQLGGSPAGPRAPAQRCCADTRGRDRARPARGGAAPSRRRPAARPRSPPCGPRDRRHRARPARARLTERSPSEVASAFSACMRSSASSSPSARSRSSLLAPGPSSRVSAATARLRTSGSSSSAKTPARTSSRGARRERADLRDRRHALGLVGIVELDQDVLPGRRRHAAVAPAGTPRAP